MKNEIKLHHLVGYLPYKLHIQVYGEIKELIGIREWIGWCVTYKSKYGETNIPIKSVKPILKPLNSLFEDDFLNDVQDFVGLGNWCEAYDDYFMIWFDDVANIDNLILQAPHPIFEYFLHNHYDVFGLIPKGLAIEKNN